MPMARNRYASLAATTYYHCIGRCVRRAFLWGKDHFSGRAFSHRKAWVVERLAELSEVFSMSVCAYAVMSNHQISCGRTMEALKSDSAKAQSQSDKKWEEFLDKTGAALNWTGIVRLISAMDEKEGGRIESDDQAIKAYD